MITTFKGKRISGMLTVMPENEYDYDEETKEIATLQTRRLKKIMGFGKRRAAKETSTSSDFCVYGLGRNWCDCCNRIDTGLFYPTYQ